MSPPASSGFMGCILPLLSMCQPYWTCGRHFTASTTLSLLLRMLSPQPNFLSQQKHDFLRGPFPGSSLTRPGFPVPSHSTLYFLFGALNTVGIFWSMPTCLISLVSPWRQGPCLLYSWPCLEYIHHSRNVCWKSPEPLSRWSELESSLQEEAAI